MTGDTARSISHQSHALDHSRRVAVVAAVHGRPQHDLHVHHHVHVHGYVPVRPPLRIRPRPKRGNRFLRRRGTTTRLHGWPGGRRRYDPTHATQHLLVNKDPSFSRPLPRTPREGRQLSALLSPLDNRHFGGRSRMPGNATERSQSCNDTYQGVGHLRAQLSRSPRTFPKTRGGSSLGANHSSPQAQRGKHELHTKVDGAEEDQQ